MIQVNEDFLENPEYIRKVIEKAKKQMEVKKKRYRRYTRRNKVGNHINVPLEYYIVNIASGYFGGIAPSITVKQEVNEARKKAVELMTGKKPGVNADPEEYQILIDYIRESNDDPAVFYQLVKDFFITSSCYAIQYSRKVEDGNKLIYARVRPDQAVALYNYEVPADEVGLVRIWMESTKGGEPVEMVEVITRKKKHYWKGDQKQPGEYKLQKDMEEDVVWKLLPVFSVEHPDGLSIFSAVEDLIDSIEVIIQNNRDTFSQNADAKLVATGYAPEHKLMIQEEDGTWIENPARKVEEQAILNSKILYVGGDPDINSGFHWLIKELNDTASENHKKTLMDLVFLLSGPPNMTDIGFTNADNASALEKKFFPLEQIVMPAHKLFHQEYQELFENFTDRINTEHGRSFDSDELDIQFKRNLPANDAQVVSTWLSLRGLLSDETVISNLPFDIDVESEKSRLEEERADGLDNYADREDALKDDEETDDVGRGKQSTDKVPEESADRTKVPNR